MTTISLKIDPELNTRIDLAARAARMSKSNWLRLAAEAYLAPVTSTAPDASPHFRGPPPKSVPRGTPPVSDGPITTPAEAAKRAADLKANLPPRVYQRDPEGCPHTHKDKNWRCIACGQEK